MNIYQAHKYMLEVKDLLSKHWQKGSMTSTELAAALLYFVRIMKDVNHEEAERLVEIFLTEDEMQTARVRRDQGTSTSATLPAPVQGVVDFSNLTNQVKNALPSDDVRPGDEIVRSLAPEAYNELLALRGKVRVLTAELPKKGKQ